MKKSNKRYRTKEQLLQDALIILNAPLKYGTKYTVLNDICWIWSESQGKYEGCKYWSKEALKDLERVNELKKAKKKFKYGDFFVHEHIVPRTIIIDKIINTENLDKPTLEDLFDKYLVSAVVTVSEDSKLNSSGYRQKMPEEFNDKTDLNYNNPWIRYKKNNIIVEKIIWRDGKIIDRTPLLF